MSVRKLGGVAVERLGGACWVVLVCLTGRGLAFSTASLARLRALTVVPVLSLRALGLSFVVAMVVDVVVLRTDSVFGGGECFEFELARIIAFSFVFSGRGPCRAARVNHRSAEPYSVFEIVPIHNICPFIHNTFLLAAF